MGMAWDRLEMVIGVHTLFTILLHIHTGLDTVKMTVLIYPTEMNHHNRSCSGLLTAEFA
jgi:hypothetical protein